MRFLTAASLVLASSHAAFAQDITVAPSPVRQGQTLTVSGMPCAAGAATVTFDGTSVAATPGTAANTFDVATQSLAAKPYKVVFHCGTAASKETSVRVDPASPAAS